MLVAYVIVYLSKTTTFTYNINIHLCDTPVKCVKSLRLLGLTVDHNMSWEPHLSAIVKRLQSAIGLLYILRLFLDKKSMLLYYNSYVLPIFDNCMNIWGNAADVHIKKLQVLQNRAARIILNVDMNMGSEWLCKQLGWMNINKRSF